MTPPHAVDDLTRLTDDWPHWSIWCSDGQWQALEEALIAAATS